MSDDDTGENLPYPGAEPYTKQWLENQFAEAVDKELDALDRRTRSLHRERVANRVLWIVCIIVAAWWVFAPDAHAAGCLKKTGTRTSVNTYNELTSVVTYTLRGKQERRVRARVKTYRRGKLEYSDSIISAQTPGPQSVESYEQLPLTWRGERLRVVVTLKASCGTIRVTLKPRTRRNPNP